MNGSLMNEMFLNTGKLFVVYVRREYNSWVARGAGTTRVFDFSSRDNVRQAIKFDNMGADNDMVPIIIWDVE